MEAKEKAKFLCNKFSLGGWGKENSKRCVEQVLENIEATKVYHQSSKAIPFNEKYWNEVMEHLNSL